MKKIYLFILTAICCAFISCTIESSDGGDLDGMWRIVSIDTVATGGQHNISEENRFWSVQGKILEVSTRRTDKLEKIIFRFDHTADSLHIYDCRENDRRQSDSLMTDTTRLLPYGITHTEQTFHVDALDGKRMTLSTPELQLNFKKF